MRQQPPEVRCWTLTGRTSRSGLVAGEPDGQVGGEPQDHVLVAAEAAGQPQPVAGGLAALALVVGDAFGYGAAVPGADLGQFSVIEVLTAGGAGCGGGGIGVNQQVGHGPCPDLPVRVEGVEVPQVTQVVRAAPGVQRVSQVLIAGVAVPAR